MCPQLNYGVMPQWIRGQIAYAGPRTIESYTLALVAQVSTVTFAGVTDNAGPYSIRVVGPDGLDVTVTYTAAGSVASAAIATGVIAAWNATPLAAGIAIATTGGAGVVTLTFLRNGTTYVVTSIVTAGTGVVATPTAAGGTSVGLGVAVVRGAASPDGINQLATAIVTGSVEANVLGFTVRNIESQVNAGSAYGSAAAELFEPGEVISVMRQGTLIAMVETAVTAGLGVFVRKVTPGTGDVVGMPRFDADTANAIALPGATFGSSTTGRGLAVIVINRP